MFGLWCGWSPIWYRLAFSIHRNHLASIERTTTTFGETELRIQIHTGFGNNQRSRWPLVHVCHSNHVVTQMWSLGLWVFRLFFFLRFCWAILSLVLMHLYSRSLIDRSEKTNTTQTLSWIAYTHIYEYMTTYVRVVSFRINIETTFFRENDSERYQTKMLRLWDSFVCRRRVRHGRCG